MNEDPRYLASSLTTCDLVSQLLLGVDGDHRITGSQVLGGLVVDVGELGIPVRVTSTFKGFRVRPQPGAPSDQEQAQ